MIDGMADENKLQKKVTKFQNPGWVKFRVTN